MPVLAQSLGPLTGFKWLQYVSAIVALVIIAAWAALRLRQSARRESVVRVLPPIVRIAWWISLPVILVAAWTIGVVARGPLTAGFTVQHLAYLVLPPACAVWGALTVVICLVLPAFRHAHQIG